MYVIRTPQVFKQHKSHTTRVSFTIQSSITNKPYPISQKKKKEGKGISNQRESKKGRKGNFQSKRKQKKKERKFPIKEWEKEKIIIRKYH